jgi:hypothetical protein
VLLTPKIEVRVDLVLAVREVEPHQAASREDT